MNSVASSHTGFMESYVTGATVPMILVMLIGVLLITYLPPLTTFLPRLLK